jgi:DNA repair photolyase
VKKKSASLISQMLRRRVPIHFGGMSDGFQVAEQRNTVSLGFLNAISEYQYPTVISTKSRLLARSAYLNSIVKCRAFIVVQFSFCTVDDKVSREVEPSAPLPTEKLAAMKELSQEGVAVTCRWQPFIKVLPGNNGEFVDAVHQAGAMHLSFEHLKIGFWREIISKKSTILLSALEDYRRRGRVRDGWEWVLAPECKVDDLVQVRELCHRLGMSLVLLIMNFSICRTILHVVRRLTGSQPLEIFIDIKPVTL